MAQRMLGGGSAGRRPESVWKNTNHGYLIPACRKTPADAAVSNSHTHIRFPSSAACETIDFEMKPEVSGNAEIASAPMVPQAVVKGMVWNRPPRSEHLRLSVINSTEPADISSNAL